MKWQLLLLPSCRQKDCSLQDGRMWGFLPGACNQGFLPSSLQSSSDGRTWSDPRWVLARVWLPQGVAWARQAQWMGEGDHVYNCGQKERQSFMWEMGGQQPGRQNQKNPEREHGACQRKVNVQGCDWHGGLGLVLCVYSLKHKVFLLVKETFPTLTIPWVKAPTNSIKENLLSSLKPGAGPWGGGR